jgi:hypothetical protein
MAAGGQAAPHPAQGGGGTYILGSMLQKGLTGSAKVFGGSIRGGLHAKGGDIVVDGNTIIDPDVAITAEVGTSVELKKAHLADRFVDEVHVATSHDDGITSPQVSTWSGTTASLVGPLPDTDQDHVRVGQSMAAHLGKGHEVIPEDETGQGAILRDGQRDQQVDVFLKARTPAEDHLLQVVRLEEVAKSLGTHDAAIDLVIDPAVIQETIRGKKDCTSKDTIDLVVSCPLPIISPTWRTLEGHRFNGFGYVRVWVVDGARHVLQLALAR